MASWLALLAGCVIFGAAVVAALVLSRTVAPLASITGLAGLVGALDAFGILAARYDSFEAVAAATFVLLAGTAAGFAVAATALPHLAPRTRPVTMPGSATNASHDAVVLLACTEPERYDPRAVALRQNLLAESAEIEVPTTALPFVFYADKARYRAVGGRAPGSDVMRELVTRVAACLGDRVGDVEPAWSHNPASLTLTIARLAAKGATTVSIVVLGASESAHLEAARAVLDRSLRDGDGPAVHFGPPVWNDRCLPDRLAARVLALTEGVSHAEVGVVLVDQGLPPVWERRYSSAGNVENYFDQRVRMLLCEAGLAEQHVRIAWLEWQAPNVTEVVRHLAALGCTRIVVAAATIALPTLETALDLRHAISLARVPESVHVMTLAPWGGDEAFVNAVCASALEPLEQAATGEPRR